MSGDGPAWPAPPDPLPAAPRWADARALTAVWRDSLTIAVGGLHPGAQRDFPEIRPGAPWRRSPEADSDGDVYQAIAAKLYLSLRMLPLLAQAQLVGVEPVVADILPVPAPDEELLSYAPAAELAASPLFLDLEGEDGEPVTWEQDTWPLPFHLRGALFWKDAIGLCVIPFGSVAGQHLIGGTDYQPWARLVFVAGRDEGGWPPPGPGDVLVDARGDAYPWVELESDSITAHQARISTNLAMGAVSLLMLLERLELPLVERPLRRAARRRAQRAGQRIGLIPEGMPQPAASDWSDSSWRHAGEQAAATVECPVDAAHTRLNQAHVFWHEALDAYDDPDLFVTKLNALLTALRSVTFVLQKQMRHTEGFNDWYEVWQSRMKADPFMDWLVKARNAIEKEGDLDTASVAAVSIEGDWPAGGEALIDVDPGAGSAEIVRRVRLRAGLPDRVRREGVLVVERRWTVDELGGKEILDALAHCFGVLAGVIAEAHTRAGAALEQCAVSDDDEHRAAILALSPSGRSPCMAASREARTSRRNLSSGAPVSIAVSSMIRPTEAQLDQAVERYGLTDADHIPSDADLGEQARRMHHMGREVLLKDGHHQTIVWLGRGGQPLGMGVLRPEDQRDKHLMIDRLATEVTKLGAEDIIFMAEMWEAPRVPFDDARASLRAEERDDRTESFLTCLIRRHGTPVSFRSAIVRDEDTLSLKDAQELVGEAPLFLAPVLRAWELWPT